VTPRAELRGSAPWGSGAGEVPLSTTPWPLFGDVLEDELRHVPAPLRIALDPLGGVHALAGGAGEPAAVVHFDANGAVAARTSLAPDTAGRIVDFAVDVDGGVYVLSTEGAGGARLRKIVRGGGQAWSRDGADLGIGEGAGTTPPRLLLDGGSRLHVVLDDGRGTVLRLDGDGGVEHVFHAEAGGNRAFITPDGKLVFATWFADRERRGVVVFDPRDGSRVERVGDDEAHRWLTWPLGVDADARIYAWHFGALARLAAEGVAEPLARVDHVVVRPGDGAVFLSRGVEGAEAVLEVEAHRPGAAPSIDTLALSDGEAAGWRLVHVDDDDRRYLLSEAPGMPASVAVFSAGGERVAEGGAGLLPDESRLQPPDSWRVDPSGRLYLPLVDGAGFRVVRLAFDPV
jgi:hypothetical protein